MPKWFKPEKEMTVTAGVGALDEGAKPHTVTGGGWREPGVLS